LCTFSRILVVDTATAPKPIFRRGLNALLPSASSGH
jgi:hypothetical protein